MSVTQALEAYTIGAARAAGFADERGSLEAGKLADLVVLSANPVESRPDDLASIQVVETWVGGERVDRPPLQERRASADLA